LGVVENGVVVIKELAKMFFEITGYTALQECFPELFLDVDKNSWFLIPEARRILCNGEKHGIGVG
jgi:hypothetical protein